jgi:hypothetical protein
MVVEVVRFGEDDEMFGKEAEYQWVTCDKGPLRISGFQDGARSALALQIKEIHKQAVHRGG